MWCFEFLDEARPYLLTVDFYLFCVRGPVTTFHPTPMNLHKPYGPLSSCLGISVTFSVFCVCGGSVLLLVLDSADLGLSSQSSPSEGGGSQCEC